jgi:hypothetical protein
MGKIKDLQISRLLLGGNLLTHFTHSRDLRYVYNLTVHYNTEEKICETMAVAEAHGVNTLVIHTAPGVVSLLKRYRYRQGGSIPIPKATRRRSRSLSMRASRRFISGASAATASSPRTKWI